MNVINLHALGSLTIPNTHGGKCRKQTNPEQEEELSHLVLSELSGQQKRNPSEEAREAFIQQSDIK